MRSRTEMTRHLLDCAYHSTVRHLDGITLEEALYVPEGGYRSVLGTLKHAAGWSHVYRSYAFDANPKHWNQVAWPRGLRDTIATSEEYVAEVIAWFKLAHQQWMEALSGTRDEQLDEMRPLHWGEEAPLYDIVVRIAGHHLYRARLLGGQGIFHQRVFGLARHFDFVRSVAGSR